MSDRDRVARTRVRLAASCVLLVGLAFVQSPGYVVADTKFDLAVDPVGFLGRALHLWDDLGAFGQLQNQAYGYLWPMGPFFALGDLAGLPDWVVQRSWLALVMCVSFVGAALLCRALGVRSDVAVLLAGFAYATSPRMLSTLGPISIEAWPSALAPWVLLPLVVGTRRGSPRRMAMLAGLAVAMVGGVNAAATFAVLPLGVLWLLTRTPGPRRRSLMLWWPVFTALGTVWWLVPLFLMGAYSPPFLDFIESASVTTFPTTPFDSLRGTSAWVPYLEPAWQGGNQTLTEGYLALNSGVVLMLGLAGMAVRSNPHRQFLALATAGGLLLVGMGHLGAVQGWFADPLNDLLDGVLAPVRNVHKFDPVVRLPLVVGLAWLVDAVLRGAPPTPVEVAGRTLQVSARPTVVALAVLGVVAAATPVLAGRLAPTDPVLATPDYWQETVAWLEERSPDEVALLAPGSGFADYRWGSPRDEPAQYLPGSRWAVRNAIPLTPPGNIRMLDAFEERLAQGRGSTGLAPFLARAGVRYVVVRNDLSPSSDVPDPVLVHQALDSSPGLSRVRSFGPDIGGEANLQTDEGRLLVNGGWQDERPVVEVYAVAPAGARAVTAERLPVVVGGPEDLLDLADHGSLVEEPTRLAADVRGDERPDGPLVLTDGMRDRERFFGRVHDGYSPVSTPGDRRRSGNPVEDYRLTDDDRWSTTARLLGAASVSASTSQSDATAPGGARPGRLPYAALDGSPETEWVAGVSDRAAWWQVDLEAVGSPRSVDLTLGGTGPDRMRVTVVTEAGETEEVELRSGIPRPVTLPPGPTRWVRVRNESSTGPLALAEVALPTRDVRRQLVLPVLPRGWGTPDQVLLRAALDSRTGCAVVDDRTPCVESRTRPSEEATGLDRRVELAWDRSYPARLRAQPVAGAGLDALLQQDQPLNATGSSVGVEDARASGLAAVDGDPGTSWTPSLDDDRPELALNWLGRQRITGLDLAVDPDAPVRRPTRVLLRWPGGEREVDLDDDGRARFPAVRTDRMSLRVLDAGNAASVDDTGAGSRLPAGISELRIAGLPYDPVVLPTRERRWACGSGPDLDVNGEVRRTRLVASARELYAMSPVEAVPCGGDREVTLQAGTNEIRMTAGAAATAHSLLLGDLSSTAGAVPAAASSASAGEQEVSPDAGAAYLVLRQNANAGWVATQDGTTLDPVVVDGWQQGFAVDGSDEAVVARFAPDTPYRWALAAGLGLLALLGSLLLVPARRFGGRHLPAVGPRPLPPLALAPLAVVVGGLLGGWPGAACGALGAAGGLVAGRRAAEAVGWSAGGLVLVASAAYFVRPWGDPGGWAGDFAWPHYLVLVSVGAVLAVGAAPGPRLFRAMHGRSTSR